MFRNVEVSDINTLFLGYEDVAWLYIPVTYPLFVQVSNTLQDLTVDLLSVSFVITTHACDCVENFVAFNKLHDLLNFVLKIVLEDLNCPHDILVF